MAINRKTVTSLLLAVTLAVSSAALLGGCGSSDKNSGTTPEEQEASVLASKAVELNKKEENFYGTWKATSANAEYLYGHLLITINEDGTFDADISDEKFSGTWKKIDGGIEYDSELIHGKLFFGKKCRMVIEEQTEDEDLHVTLVKVD